MTMNTPAWNIETEYPSIQSETFIKDWESVGLYIKQIQSLVEKLNLTAFEENPANTSNLVSSIQEIYILAEKGNILISNLGVYLNCLLSVDATDLTAKQKFSELELLSSQFNQALTPTNLFISRCDESVFKEIINHPHLAGYEFNWSQKRTRSIHLLSEQEEILLDGLSTSGYKAWANLYDNLSGVLKIKLNYPNHIEEVGLAHAHSLTRSKSEEDRKAAWLGIQETWSQHQETASAIVNSLAGWRHEISKRRSHKKETTFLDEPLFGNRISKETLDAMMTVCRNNIADIQKAPLLMAKVLKKDKLDPWDILAPCPISGSSQVLSFDEGINLITESFAEISDEMADFVKMMVSKNWIEGRVLPNKKTGAYCTGFAKSQEPRVYMTYMGSNNDISTLAHELGHAFHSWVIRDLPQPQRKYPMTLAETASIFAETALSNALIQKATSFEEKVEFAWGNAEQATNLLLNIPVRFEFEKKFYELRKERTLSPTELRQLMGKTWSKWYGNSVSQTDDLFWAHKLHFHLSDVSFYNFPYTFGYLFSLSLFARRVDLGADFMSTYIAILRDTGRMTAEDLVSKHLGEDIRKSKFWQKSIDLVLQKVNLLDMLIQ